MLETGAICPSGPNEAAFNSSLQVTEAQFGGGGGRGGVRASKARPIGGPNQFSAGPDQFSSGPNEASFNSSVQVTKAQFGGGGVRASTARPS